MRPMAAHASGVGGSRRTLGAAIARAQAAQKLSFLSVQHLLDGLPDATPLLKKSVWQAPAYSHDSQGSIDRNHATLRQQVSTLREAVKE